MSDSERSDIDDIRARKREELQSALETPDDPAEIDGEEQFSETIDRHRIVLVDFYADWCGPCEMVEPIVEEIAAETEAVVVQVDVDANQQLAQQHGIRSVPTLQLYVDGEQAEQLVGVQEKATLVELIERHG